MHFLDALFITKMQTAKLHFQFYADYTQSMHKLLYLSNLCVIGFRGEPAFLSSPVRASPAVLSSISSKLDLHRWRCNIHNYCAGDACFSVTSVMLNTVCFY